MRFAPYTLLDGEQQNRKHPRTFHIPSLIEKELVSKGDYVQLSFSCEGYDTSERMWVRVTGQGVGILDNDPAFLPLVSDMLVHYEPRHIIKILKKDEV